MTAPVTAESLNRATHELARRMLAQPEVDLYEKRGKQLSFLPDRSEQPLPREACLKGCQTCYPEDCNMESAFVSAV